VARGVETVVADILSMKGGEDNEGITSQYSRVGSLVGIGPTSGGTLHSDAGQSLWHRDRLPWGFLVFLSRPNPDALYRHGRVGIRRSDERADRKLSWSAMGYLRQSQRAGGVLREATSPDAISLVGSASSTDWQNGELLASRMGACVPSCRRILVSQRRESLFRGPARHTPAPAWWDPGAPGSRQHREGYTWCAIKKVK
jgi:hypothetical protein